MCDTSATSPSRMTRQQEKDELASLNDRFAAYKEKVRGLTDQNLQMKYEMEQITTQNGREAEEVKRLYETELADARRLIDETAKEKARQQLQASKYLSRVKEVEAELRELREEMEALKERVSVAERNAASMDAQRKSALSDKYDLLKQIKDRDTKIEDQDRKIRDLEAEREEMRANAEELRAAYERETLAKVDYQNQVQTLKEEKAFNEKVHDEKIATIRSKHVFTSFSEAFEPSNVDFAIDELREESILKIEDWKKLLEDTYTDKIAKYEAESDRNGDLISQLKSDIYRMTRTIKEKTGDTTKLLAQIEKLEALCDSKDADFARECQKHSSEISKVSEECRNLRVSYDAQVREYAELFDLKVHLEQEIATYRALLEEEEAKLKLSPTPRKRRATQALEQSLKKSRFETPAAPPPSSSSQVSSSAAGCIQIFDVDPEGRFVKIKNLSSSPESVGGFKIAHDVHGGIDVAFKFHQKSKLQGGACVTVWGSEASGAVHSPPQQIIWRNQPTWGAGAKTVTKLLNKSSEVVASFTSSCESVDSGSGSILSFPRLSEEGAREKSFTSTTTTSTTSRGQEQMFHQRGDPPQDSHPPHSGNSSCVIS